MAEPIGRDIVWVPFDIMERFMVDAFVGAGVPEADAKACAEVLIASDKRGIDSHGVARFKAFYYDRIKEKTLQPVTRFEVVRDGPTTAVIDGHDGMGHLIGRKAMELCIAKARKFGMGMAAVRNSSHYGIAGYYAMMACEAGMVGITGTNARPSVAPTFGVENMLGTNPLTFGMPTDEEFPFVLDCATSLAQRGKIEIYARAGKTLPEGWVIGEDGRAKTDSAAVLQDLVSGKAALVPLGGIGEEGSGYKGYGYAAVVEILSAALQGGGFLKMLSGLSGGKKVPCHLGHFFMAVDIAAFCPVEEFKKTTGDILRALRAAKKMPGAERIYTAGEKEHLAWLERRDKGVPVNKELQKEIKAVQAELGLKHYSFPF